ncbi:MAG: low molecular weight phosphotyrosine protein phosphatase [Bifidobacteriaceae bacterium]|jgi:protein-tyrosine phosphatase|nr:low molecular weight phosphotyrosine protein phosphatase [Bifidobacteriaceae bacterium]
MNYIVNAVCTGNICRSAMAQIVLEDAFKKENMDIKVISSGISDEENGNPMDPRAADVLLDRGYEPHSHIAHKVTGKELKSSDLTLAMTHKHANQLLKMGVDKDSLYMYRQFENTSDPEIFVERDGNPPDITDPWYGDEEDFEIALDQIEESVRNIVKFVYKRTKEEQAD